MLWQEFSSFVSRMSIRGFGSSITSGWMQVILSSVIMARDKGSVTELIRGLNLKENCYNSFLNFFSTTSINLEIVISGFFDWVSEKCDSKIYKIRGKYLFIADGKKVSKEGKYMPGVKSLHQDSENSGKARFIMGHHFQMIGLAVGSLNFGYLFLPIMCLFAEKMKRSPNEKKTIFTRLIENLSLLKKRTGGYLVADAYYSVGTLMKELREMSMLLITRVAHNTVGYKPCNKKNNNDKKGRKQKYGEKVKLIDIFNTANFTEQEVFLYGEYQKIQTYCINLLWKPLGQSVRFVLVIMPNGKKIILMSQDNTLTAKEIVEAYGIRFKIEVGIKVACQEIGTFAYRFWSKYVKKIKRGSGAQCTHRYNEEAKEALHKKEKSYEVYTQIGCMVQGFLVYLSVFFKDEVLTNFNDWYRTTPDKKYPSEAITISVMQASFWEFCQSNQNNFDWIKLIIKNQRSAGFYLFIKQILSFR